MIRKLKRRDKSVLANKIVVALFLVDGIGGSSQQNQQNQREGKRREDGWPQDEKRSNRRRPNKAYKGPANAQDSTQISRATIQHGAP